MNSFDVNSTVFFPVLGGILAGGIVIVIELSFRVLWGLNQRKRGIKDISKFFGGWEVVINGNPSLQENPWVGLNAAAKDPVQLATHRAAIRLFDFAIFRWSKYLSDQQLEEIYLLLVILPSDTIASQEFYDGFFREARKIKWLKF